MTKLWRFNHEGLIYIYKYTLFYLFVNKSSTIIGKDSFRPAGVEKLLLGPLANVQCMIMSLYDNTSRKVQIQQQEGRNTHLRKSCELKRNQ